ncbi:MAG: cytochrome-c peroxidase [Cyclobacteriaceae bacterium]|nr:c-type cytochrome [Cyclobacteriaceae bacterium]MCH8517588.1 cytochrome-c peroxidase [Cyclobacteriaceae bacterium]
MRYWFFLFGMLLLACDTDTGQQLRLASPFAAGDSIPHPENNPFTEAGILLGEKLFFDPSLSRNGQVSCASCHFPDRAFSDGVALSKAGVSGQPLDRHSPHLMNLAWADQGLFWDGGGGPLESMMFGPLMHEDEMGADLLSLTERMRQDEFYAQAFYEAFGTDSLLSMHISHALSQYVRTLVSFQSDYDRFLAGDENALEPLAKRGLSIFEKHCSSCHSGVHLSDFGFHNNGLDTVFQEGNEGVHLGRYRISGESADMGRFKTPSLRNVAITAPYMHDGRFATLEEVLDHYSEGIKHSPTVDITASFQLKKEEKEALLAFLHVLTDSSFLENPQLVLEMQ